MNTTNNAATSVPVLSRSLLLLFALPGILQSFMVGPSGAVLQGVYAKESGITLIALGVAVLVVRVFDLFSDLLIGYLSDYSAQRGVSRKRWMAAGTIVTVIALWFLFRPPPQPSVMYYGCWFLLANIGWSLVEIPYRAWSLEFSPEPAQRSRIATWIALLSMFGGMLFYAVAPAAKALGLLETAEMNLQLLALVAIVIVLLLPAMNFLTLWRVPDVRVPMLLQPKAEIPKESFALLRRSVIGNPGLIRFLACFVLVNLLWGMSNGVSLLFLTNYMMLGESANTVLAMGLPFSMMGIPFWGWVMTKYPHQKVWALALMLAGLFFAAMGLLPPYPNLVLFSGAFSLMMFCFLSGAVATPVIMGDIIDYGREKFGVERAGLYWSFKNQVLKGVNAIAAGGGMILLGWMGFDATQTGAEIPPQAAIALKWVVAWLPAIGMLLTGALLWVVPISRDMKAAKLHG